MSEDPDDTTARAATKLDKARPEVPQLAALTGPGHPEGAPADEPPGTCPHCGATQPEKMSFCSSCGESLGPDLLQGKVLDARYEVIRRLGAGAMGAVYEVRHLRLGKRFAMKVIHRELTQVPEFVARFEREARSTSRLQHPNCILVTDFGHAPTGELYLVMELLEGKPLSDFLDGPMPVGTAIEMARQILLGVQHAHQAGVIHRDLKPENVVRVENPDGTWQVKVVDFGIAKLGAAGGSDKEPLTKAGVVFGTPEYMAPEQALGGQVGAQADVYAVGVILWRMLTGRPLFEAQGPVEVLAAKLANTAPLLSDVVPRTFSPPLVDLVRRMVARNPSDRIASVDEVLQILEEVRRAPGGGLLVAAAPGTGAAVTARLTEIPRQVAGLSRQVSGMFRIWYSCADQGASAPSWRLRFRALVTTAGGRAVLAVTVIAVAGLSLVALFAMSSGEEKPKAQPRVLSTAGSAPRSSTRRPIAPSTKAPAEIPSPGAQPPKTAAQGRLARAQGLLTAGDCREAALELKSLLRGEPRLAHAHYLLGVASFCRKLHSEGLAEYQESIRLDGGYREDARILEDVERLLRVPKLGRAALDFLRTHIGKPALPALLRAASTSSRRALRHGAIDLVAELGATSQIDWLSSLSLDLHDGPSCTDRGEAVAKLRALKDPRAIPALRRARGERTGWFGRQYKNWCIRDDIGAALRDLQSLPGAEKQ